MTPAGAATILRKSMPLPRPDIKIWGWGIAACLLASGCAGSLIRAAEKGDTPQVISLLDKGAKIDQANEYGFSALGMALLYGHEETAEVLLKRGAPAGGAGPDGHTALHSAAERGFAAAIKRMLAQGIAVDPKAAGGKTPLMSAAEKGHGEAVKALLGAGADAAPQDKYGRTALLIAAGNGHAGAVDALLQAGGDVKAADPEGYTALMLAAEKGHGKVMRLLLESGADPRAENDRGQTALMLAEANGHSGAANVLRTGGPGENPPRSAPSPPKHAPRAAVRSTVDRPSYRLRPDPRNFALVVGVEKYMGLPDADFAENDARAMRDHLLALGYPERNIIFITGPEAGRAGMEKNLESWLPRNVKAESRVFFFFSGHGAPDPKTGQAYLVPWDGDAKFLENTGYPLKRLYEKLGSLRAREVILVMDACFSGSGGRSVLAKGTRPIVPRISLDAVGSGKLTVFSAAAADEITGTEESAAHGLFTYYFLKGLNGAARDGNGKLTAGSLFDYLLPQVQDAARRQNRDQTPQLSRPEGGGTEEMVLR